MKGKKFKIQGFKGIYKVTHVSRKGYLAEASSNTGGRVSLTKNIHSGRWIPTKGSRTLPRVRWL